MERRTDPVNDSNIAQCFDVIVIGTGFAGLAAAIEAKRAGASVCMLEKMKAAGGNRLTRAGGAAHPRFRRIALRRYDAGWFIFESARVGAHAHKKRERYV